MRAFSALSVAIFKGLLRDRETLFFTLVFPLFFIILFGSIFGGSSPSAQKVVRVGDVAILDALPADAMAELGKIIEFQGPEPLEQALDEVRSGDVAAAVEQVGDRIVLHVSAADQVKAATVTGVFNGLVNESNLAVAGVVTAKFSLDTAQVEDESLTAVQWVAPGMIGYGIAIGATFGAAMTLVTWREKKVLRRLRLAPVPTSSIVGSRVMVSLGVALVQLVIFIGVAMLPFLGLQLRGAWYMAIPLVICGTLAFLSIGLVVGAVAKTAEGASALANLITLPMAFLSGAFIPLDAAPSWIGATAKVLPMGHLVSGLQDVLVRGQSASSALVPMAILLGFAVVLVGIATRLFRWDNT